MSVMLPVRQPRYAMNETNSVSELEAFLTKTGFSDFTFHQTPLPGETIDLSVREGYGSGGFLVMRAYKVA